MVGSTDIEFKEWEEVDGTLRAKFKDGVGSVVVYPLQKIELVANTGLRADWRIDPPVKAAKAAMAALNLTHA